MPTRAVLSAAVLALLAGSAKAADLPSRVDLPSHMDPRLVPAYQASEVWNAVTTTKDGRVFVGFPQVSGQSAQLEEMTATSTGKPYPDAAWNQPVTGGDPAHAFVHVNAIRIGPDGALWVVDAGSPGIGKPAVKGGARLIRIDLQTNAVAHVFDLSAGTGPDSYIDDVRFHGHVAYLTDAGVPGLLVLDLTSGVVRRVLDHDPSTIDDRSMRADGKVLTDEQGRELRVHADQLEVSPDGAWLYYQPASGRLARIATRYIDDPALPPAELAHQVVHWLDTPTTGGTAIDAAGNIFLSDTDHRRILRITPKKRISVLISDVRLIWSDAMWIDDAGLLWIPATQQNLTPGFNGGTNAVKYPVWIYKMRIGVGPSPIDHP